MTKITISGTPGSGKSVIAEKLCQKYKLKYYDLGKLMRKAAKERNLKLEELQELRKTDDSIDIELDKKTEKIGKEEDNFIFVGRLAYHFIPDSIKIYLKCELEIGAKRILKHNDESRNVEILNDLNDAIQKLKERQEKDKKLLFFTY